MNVGTPSIPTFRMIDGLSVGWFKRPAFQPSSVLNAGRSGVLNAERGSGIFIKLRARLPQRPMGEAEWLAVGLVIGVLIGLPLGWMLFQLSQPKQAPQQQAPQQQAKAASVVFDRDEAGRITGIHYVPA